MKKNRQRTNWSGITRIGGLLPAKTVWLVLLLFVTMEVSAVNSVLSQRVTINVKNTELREVFRTLRQQTGHMITFSEDKVDTDRTRITVDIKDLELSEALDIILNGLPYTYKVSDQRVFIIPTPAKAARTQAPQIRSVSGRVTGENGEALAGVTVMLKGTTRGVASDGRGNYTIEYDPATETTLLVSYVGYKQQEIRINNRATINIALEPNVVSLDDLVVTGYQAIPRERAAGSIDILSGDQLARPASDIGTLLQGQATGLKGSFNEYGELEYMIRGVSTLSADRKPLVVVDGFPVENGFSDINPNDVQNVVILKDAAAASIWGARSGNGVIVITTKKGASAGGGKAYNVSVNTMFRIGRKDNVGHLLNVATSEETVFYEKKAWDNGWVSSSRYTGSFANDLYSPLSKVTEALYKFDAGTITESQLNSELDRLSKIDNRKQIKKHLLANPTLQQYNVTISGSSDRVQNYISLMYEHETGKLIRNTNDRFRIRYNTTVKVFKWLDFDLSTNIHRSRENVSGPTLDDVTNKITGELRQISPYELILDENGDYVDQNKINHEMRATIPDDQLVYPDWSYNVLREIRSRKFTNEIFNTRVQAGLTFKIIEGLNYETKFQYEHNKNDMDRYYSPDTYLVRNLANYWMDYDQTTQTTNKQFIPKGGILDKERRYNENWNFRNQVNFSRTFASRHHVTALAGMEVQRLVYDPFKEGRMFGYDPDRNSSSPLPYGHTSISGANQLKVITGTNQTSIPDATPKFDYDDIRKRNQKYRNDRYVSVYANASYSFDDTYIIQGSVRSDASNLISEDPKYRWAPLWSVGGMWHMHKEEFLSPTSDWLNRLSLRLTYGVNGNVDKTTSHQVLLGMSTAPNANYGYLFTGSVASYGNPYLGWEKTRTFNAGFDFAVLNHKLTGSFDFYNKKGFDIIGSIALPSVLGTTSQDINNAEILNRGFEISIGYNDKVAENVSLGVNVNYSYNKNKITNLYYPSYYTYEVIEDGKFVEGYPVNSVWAFKWQGDYVDGVPHIVANDGSLITFNDVSPYNRGLASDYLIYMGPSHSPHDVGLNLSANIYGVKVSMLFLGEFGGFFRNPVFTYNQISKGKNIYPQALKYAIAQDEGLPVWPAKDESFTYLWDRYMLRLNTMVESRSHIRLKQIDVSYDIPKKIVEKIGLNSLEVYGQVLDLGCIWTKNSRGYDPYFLPGSLKPVTTFLLGLKLNF